MGRMTNGVLAAAAALTVMMAPGSAAAQVTGSAEAVRQVLAPSFAAAPDGTLIGVAVTAGDRVLIAETFSREGAVGPATRFPIGTLTKQFTAALFHELIEEGTLRARANLGELVPEFATARFVTLQAMTEHGTSLPDYAGMTFYAGIGGPGRFDRDISSADLVAGIVRELGPGFRGVNAHCQSYSNTNYAVLGLALERAARAPLAELLATRIARPLGLADTTFGVADGTPVPRGRGMQGPVPPIFPGWLGGSGAIVSSPRDMAQWHLAIRAGALHELRAAIFAGRSVAYEPCAGARIPRNGYVLGWEPHRDRAGPENPDKFSHFGMAEGYAGYALIDIGEDGHSVALLSNFGGLLNTLPRLAEPVIEAAGGR